jgi:hypothetical protein
MFNTSDFSKMADCTKSFISLSDFDRWFASDFDRWLARFRLQLVVHHAPTDGSQHPKTADRASLMFEMNTYVDLDFLGLYGKKDRTDPTNVKSQGGHVILVNGCPVIWQSKLINAICLWTMMAEYYTLSIAMREVLPLQELVQMVARGIEINDKVQTNFKVTVWEANNGCLTLANLDPYQSTPRSKFYDSKVHWFRSHLHDGESGIRVIKKVDTEEQLANLFTKPLTQEPFEKLRFMLLGW